VGAIEDAKKQAEEMMAQFQQQATAQGGGYAAANIAVGTAESDALKQQAMAMDTSGPEFQPIEGVTYDQYVQLCVKLQPAGTDAAKLQELAIANGLTAEQWKAASEGFTQRCVQNQMFARRFGLDVIAADASG